MTTRARVAVLAAVLAATWVFAPAAAASAPADEAALAARYAPVVRLVDQPERCGPGEPYVPIDVNLLFDEPTVALRGPWTGANLVKVGPSAGDLGAGLYEYHLDFPGDALNPGCDYLNWSRHINQGHQPTVYAHVVTDPGYPGQIALQYWMFYVYNDWNNLHEGDWEMIQINFPASTAAEALKVSPERGRLQPARGRRASGVGRPEARARGRDAPGRLPGRRLARQLLRSGAVPRSVWLAGRRVRRHSKLRPGHPAGGRGHPERPGPGPGRLPLDRVRGPLGRAPAGVLQRSHRAEPEDAMDGAHPLVAGLARPGLRGAGRRRAGDADDRLLLRRDGPGLAAALGRRGRPLADHRSACWPPSRF